MAVGDTHAFPGFLTPVLTQLSFQSHGLLFSQATAEVRVKLRQKDCVPQPGIELKPPSHESDTLTTEPPGLGVTEERRNVHSRIAKIKIRLHFPW